MTARRRRLVALVAALAVLVSVVGPASAYPVEWPSTFVATNVMGTAMVTDKAGFQHVLFNHQGDTDLYYATNKSGAWVTVDTGMFSPGSFFTAAIDGHGRLHVLDGCGYVTNRTGTWKYRSIGTIESGCGGATVAVDPEGEVHLVRRSDEGNLIYSTNRRGYWIHRSLGPISARPMIALDETNHVHIAAGSDYITNESGSWTSETLPFAGTSSFTRVLARSGTVRFMGATSFGIEYAVVTASGSSSAKLGPGDAATGYVVDAAGKSHVLVHNPATGGADYLTNASGSWARTSGIAVNASDLGVGPTGRRFVLTFGQSTYDLRVASSAPSPWTRTKVAGLTFGGAVQELNPSIGIGPQGTVKVAYAWPPGKGPANTVAPGLRVATWSGTAWTTESPGQSGDTETSIAVDSLGHSHVAVAREEPAHNGWYDLFYGTDATGSWVWTKLDNGSSLGCPVLRLGPTDHPFILYRETEPPNAGGPAFRLAANRTGTWQLSATLPAQTQPAQSMPCGSLALDANDRVHLLYVGNHIQRYVNDTTTAGAYTLRTSFGGATESALALDANAKAHVIYRSTEVRYRTNVTGVWVETNLAPGFDAGRGMGIAIGTNGPVTAWSAGGLTIGEKSGATWSFTGLTGAPAGTVDLAISAAGQVWALSSETNEFAQPGLNVFTR